MFEARQLSSSYLFVPDIYSSVATIQRRVTTKYAVKFHMEEIRPYTDDKFPTPMGEGEKHDASLPPPPRSASKPHKAIVPMSCAFVYCSRENAKPFGSGVGSLREQHGYNSSFMSVQVNGSCYKPFPCGSVEARSFPLLADGDSHARIY